MPPSTVEKGLQFPATGFDVYRTRQEFPILNQFVRGKPLIYLDNAATTQKPNTVLCGLNQFYGCCNSNIHRGVHFLSELATRQYEEARLNAQSFLNARSHREIIFVRGATEGINLVAQSYGRTFLKEGDEIVISAMEHHANIVPWQVVCEQTGARLRVVPINDDGEFLMEEYEKLLSDRTKIVSVVHISNALGTVNPVKEIVRKAHEAGAVALVDGAQSVAHTPVDVQDLDCDFLCLLGAQGVRAHRNRNPLWPRIAPRANAALPDRRGYDPVRHVREDGLQRTSLQVRGRYAKHRWRDRPGARTGFRPGRGLAQSGPVRGRASEVRHR